MHLFNNLMFILQLAQLLRHNGQPVLRNVFKSKITHVKAGFQLGYQQYKDAHPSACVPDESDCMKKLFETLDSDDWIEQKEGLENCLKLWRENFIREDQATIYAFVMQTEIFSKYVQETSLSIKDEYMFRDTLQKFINNNRPQVILVMNHVWKCILQTPLCSILYICVTAVPDKVGPTFVGDEKWGTKRKDKTFGK